MYKKFFFKSVYISILLSVLFSCDNNSNEIGSDIVGNDNFETGTPKYYSVKASKQDTGPVETLDLAVNTLGVYKNPVFGTIKANLAVQLQMNSSNINPTFDVALNPVFESVVLTVPYFSTKLSTNSDGESTYELDSIYGPTNSKIKLRIYESGYYIRDIDPVTQSVQKYYNDQNQLFDQVKGTLLSENNDFVFSAAELVEPGIITTEDPNPKPIRSAPGMKFTLNKDFFIAKILNEHTGKLLNNNVFKEYFRGLYFQVENSGSDEGNLAMLNIKAGKITIKYKQDKITTTTVNGVTTTTTSREDKSFVLNLDGKSVGFFENGTPPQSIISDRLYLKGGEGSMAIIDLFDGPDNNNNGFSDKLDELRANKWLVNDASLTFYIDNNAMGSSAAEPNRIYLYDLKNKRPLVDYYADQNSPSSKPKYAKSVFGGIIKKSEINVVGSDKRGTYYKFKITNHIRGLINNIDSTNVKLGLVVTENIADVSNRKLKTPNLENNISEIPTASIINPLGTILYGSGDNVPLDKRIQLKIYYTKPKQN
jgi:Domain of unknown function (DUF4270)